MADGKKSFIAYSDWKDTFDSLPDEVAGKLIKHIFAYVNDEDPTTDDYVINGLFAGIKNTLKRDLKKWDTQHQQRIDAGKKSAEARQRNADLVNGRSISSTVSDSVSVSDTESDIKKILLSELKDSDVKNSDHLKITKHWWELFVKNTKDLGGSVKTLEAAKGLKWVSHIRLLLEEDEVTTKQLRTVYDFIKKDDFWKKNIRSTEKLRKQFNELLIKSSDKPDIKKPGEQKMSRFKEVL